jgi:predicted Zn-dependent protease
MKARSILISLAASIAGISCHAFDLGGLSRSIGSGDDKITKGLDTAKDLGKVVKGVAGIGPEEEKAIGDSVALEIVGKYGGLVRDEAVVQRVNLVGRALATYSGRPDLTWRFAVLDSNSVNAFSAPAGYVFITRGLYDLATDDDALAGILGHEIAHITGKHALNIVAKGDALAGATSQLVKRSGNARALDSQLQQFDLGVSQITKTLFETGYSPQTEYDADKAGHNLAQLTGFAPGGLRGVLSRLQRRGSNDQKVFSTHPPLNDRISRLPDEPSSLSADASGKISGVAKGGPAGSGKVDADDEAFAKGAK